MLDTSQTKSQFIRRLAETQLKTDRLLNDLFAMVHKSGILKRPTARGRQASGTVKSILSKTRGMVLLDNGEWATIVHELTYPEIPLEWLIQVGQRVTGSFEPESKRLTPESGSPTNASLLEWYPNLNVTLALVLAVERQQATLAVHPGVPIVVSQRDLSSNSRDRVDLLLTVGDVVPVRVVRDAQGRAALRSHDIDDDEEVLPAPAVFTNSAPWLIDGRVMCVAEDELIFTAVDDISSVASLSHVLPPLVLSPPIALAGMNGPRPMPGIQMATVTASIPVVGITAGGPALKSALLTIDRQKSQIAEIQEALRLSGGLQAQAEIKALRLDLGDALNQRKAALDRASESESTKRETQAALRRASSSQNVEVDPRGSRSRFGCDEDWVRHEVLLAWIDRLSASDRVIFPLADNYIVGAWFAESLEALDSGQLRKAFKAVVDVLAGNVPGLAARNVHPLREGNGAATRDVSRSDGARCLRAYIEEKTASARRLHYWKTLTGALELSRIVLHDDMKP